MEPITKTIQIIDKGSKVQPKKSPTSEDIANNNLSFMKYFIKGTDGITYTWLFNDEYYQQRKIGERLTITFTTNTVQGQRGLVTYYNLVLPKGDYQAQPKFTQTVPSTVLMIIDTINKAKKEILDAITMINPIQEDTSLEHELADANKKPGLNLDIPIIEEDVIETEDGNVF